MAMNDKNRTKETIDPMLAKTTLIEGKFMYYNILRLSSSSANTTYAGTPN